MIRKPKLILRFLKHCLQEYGISEESKISIAQRVCTPLLGKLRNDLHRCVEDPEDSDETTRLDPRASEGIATPMRHVRTRLYFTSESHIHTLMNLIRYGGLCSVRFGIRILVFCFIEVNVIFSLMTKNGNVQ